MEQTPCTHRIVLDQLVESPGRWSGLSARPSTVVDVTFILKLSASKIKKNRTFVEIFDFEALCENLTSIRKAAS